MPATTKPKGLREAALRRELAILRDKQSSHLIPHRAQGRLCERIEEVRAMLAKIEQRKGGA